MKKTCTNKHPDNQATPPLSPGQTITTCWLPGTTTNEPAAALLAAARCCCRLLPLLPPCPAHRLLRLTPKANQPLMLPLQQHTRWHGNAPIGQHFITDWIPAAVNQHTHTYHAPTNTSCSHGLSTSNPSPNSSPDAKRAHCASTQHHCQVHAEAQAGPHGEVSLAELLCQQLVEADVQQHAA